MPTKWMLILDLIAGTLCFGLFSLAVNSINPVLGQELLPEVGSNEPIGKPNTNVTITTNATDYPSELGQSPLDPFFGR
jgi:hypothetical protein